MILCLDLGNTRLKWGLFDAQHTLVEAGACLHTDIETAPFYLWNECSKAVLASVAKETVTEQLLKMLARFELTIHKVHVLPSMCGLQNTYDNIQQLGIDRWAAAVGAWQQIQDACVVVNAGTAVTIDAIAPLNSNPQQANYLGGYILPGLKMMQTRLSQGTALIGDTLALAKSTPFPKNTNDAVQLGAYAAICGAIKLMATQLSQHTGQTVSIIVTGGDAKAIQAMLLAPTMQIQAVAKQVLMVDNLVLHGILWLDLESETA
jgi:type III pantothenate kinase